jgi:hypothetical protein
MLKLELAISTISSAIATATTTASYNNAAEHKFSFRPTISSVLMFWAHDLELYSPNTTISEK